MDAQLIANSVPTVHGSTDRVNVFLFAQAVMDGFIPLAAFTKDDVKNAETNPGMIESSDEDESARQNIAPIQVRHIFFFF
jgi:hypothetical protein